MLILELGGSKDLDKKPLGGWTEASKKITRNDSVDYNNEKIQDKDKRDDFTKDTPKRVRNHFINQLIRTANCVNIGQGSVDGQVEASKYPMSFFYNP